MMDKNNYPPMATHSVQSDFERKKNDLAEAFIEFHQLIKNKVLDKNKSADLKQAELEVIRKIVNAAEALNQTNIGAGNFALASIALKEHLSARDRINELEYELLKTQRTLKELMKKVGMSGEKK